MEETEMSGISDELRQFIDDDGLFPNQIDELRCIADRIDAEMMELPRDRDGSPIHVGDTVYLDDGREAKVTRIGIGMDDDSIYTIVYGDNSSFLPECSTHTRPDSWERIVDEFDEWRFEHMHYLVADDLNDLGLFAERIRKLAERKEGK